MRAPLPAKQEYVCDYDAHAAYWLTKICLSHEAYFNQIVDGEKAKSLRELMGISLPKDPPSRSALSTKLRLRAAAFKKKPPKGLSELFVNARLLARLLQLSDVEQRLVEFAALSDHHRLLRGVMASAALNRTAELISMLATALDCSVPAIRAALDRNGTLFKTSLLFYARNDYHGGITLEASERLSDILHLVYKDENDLVRQFIEPACAANLTANDYPHFADEIEMITQYLACVVKSQTVGVNILIYGQPGVGKTELVRLLAKRVGKPLYEVRSSEDNSGVIGGYDRLMSFSLSQHILHKSDALILFDELEDIFSEATGFMNRMRNGRSSAVSKAFVNKMLESNAVPTIWVSNEVSNIDPAYLRRFDMSFEIGVPPVQVRRRIIRKHLQGMRLPSLVLDKYAQHEALTPAQIEKAAKVSRMIAERGGDWNEAFQRVLDNSMMLLKQSPVPASFDLNEMHYRLDYLNADCDLPRLVEQLSQAENPQGAMCFYGAPGTGKSALAHYLSQASERPLLVRRASDILSPYVGVAEQKIAAMFKQAEQDQAILLLDEADTFLSDRKGAKASWEVSQVNEMLTQMESFKGLFICSTNLMTRLDEASLRRFALKIRFGYLKPEQRWQLFQEHIGRRARIDEAQCRAKLNQMNNLAPGDFACVRRQAALFGESLTPEKWLTRLDLECRAKPDQGSRSIGFL